MKNLLTLMTAFALLHSILCKAEDIPLGTVPVSIALTNLPKITVEKPGGGWYDTLTLTNSSGLNTSDYKMQVPVQVMIRGERNFTVALLNPLLLVNTNNSSLMFSNEEVRFGSDLNSLQQLGTSPVDFTNPTGTEDISTGNYILSVSARQPEGVIGTISGDYTGNLVLMFEVKA